MTYDVFIYVLGFLCAMMVAIPLGIDLVVGRRAGAQVRGEVTEQAMVKEPPPRRKAA